MQQHLQNKLLQHEVLPPADMWNTIARRLDDEFVATDAGLAEKLSVAEIMPPAGTWDSIVAVLDANTFPKKTRTIPLVFRRIAVAAVAIGIIAIAAMLLLNNESSTTRQPNNLAVAVPPAPSNLQPATQQPVSSSPQINSDAPDRRLIAAVAPRRTVAQKRFTNRVSNEYPTVQKIATTQPVEVDAPPIRDASGNIVMDYSLIKHPNEPYITVTSPNGLQTKISSKFLTCLSYLYSSSSSYMNYEEQQWKTKFSEWRNKLIEEPAFVPAANNFFDIFELKELIEEQ